MRVVGLFRVSTEKQEEHGTSLDSQEAAFHAMARQQGWEVVATYRGCESATQAASERRVLQQVLACIRDGDVDAVWVYEQSRLTRGDELEVALLRRELEERGVKVIVNGTVRDLSSIDEGFMFGIQTLVDRTESKRIKERMARGKKQRAQQGKKAGGPSPYGYVNPPPGQPNRGTLQVVEDEAVVVRKIFKLSMDGLSDYAVAERLNDMGIPSSRGGRWWKSAVTRVLDCPAYVGTAASGVWLPVNGTRYFKQDLTNPDAILIEHAHEPIIDPETWEAVWARPRKPRSGTPRLLTGLLYLDGEPCAGDSDKGRPVYRPASRRRGAAWLDADDTDNQIWDAFTALATGPDLVQRLLDRARNDHRQHMVAMEIEHLTDQLGKLDRRLEGLTSMCADGDITREEFRVRSDKARAEIETVRAELVSQRAQAVSFDGSHAARIVKAVQVLLAGRTRLTRDQKRRVLDSIVQRIEVSAERVGGGLKRDDRGRVLPGSVVSWALTRIEIRLALPPHDAAWGVAAEGADTGAKTPPGAARGDDARGRQLATTPFGCGLVAGTEDGEWGGSGSRQLDTISFDCGLLAVTVVAA
ncbi:MAG: recombinase family protein [Phycisphaerales bacterium]|nr:recombinase family protein [Phycisphaerales bacterium]